MLSSLAVDTVRTAIARTYLVTALVGGVIMVFLSPPFQAPDEPNHFFRAQALSEGDFVAKRTGNVVGAPMSSAIVAWVFGVFDGIAGHPERKQSFDLLWARRDRGPDDQGITFVDFRNSALYSPIAYIPQALGLGLGRLLRLPLLDAYYLGRLLTLASGVVLCYWTATRLPYGQLTFVMIALCPTFLFEQASFSADGPTCALAAAFCGTTLVTSTAAGPLSRRDVIGLSILGALAVLTKPSSAPLPLMALLLLRRATGSPPGRPWREAMVIIGISWAAMLAWSLVVSGLYVIANPAPGIDPAGQWEWIKAHPIRFAAILLQTLQTAYRPLFYSAVGVLGWLDTPLTARYVWLFSVALLASGIVAGPRSARSSGPERGLAAVLVLSTYILIGFISYLTWTPLAAPLIGGLQGRYFLPLIVPWAVLLQWPAWTQRRLGPRLRLGVTIACLAYTVFFLVHAFQTMERRYWS
jgi:uncharacterized membrane protein